MSSPEVSVASFATLSDKAMGRLVLVIGFGYMLTEVVKEISVRAKQLAQEVGERVMSVQR